MSRDFTVFPEDELGNTLWQMSEEGDSLENEREIEFSMLFPSQELALKFGQVLLENNQKLSFTPFTESETLPWEITAYPFMAASYENIISYQDLLIGSADELEGEFNGVFFMG